MLDKGLNIFPDSPGVYFFKKGESILYIGKATSIKHRVKSYFNSDLRESRSVLIERMVEEADNIDFQETDSVLEALILESNLIKQYQPIYNTREKDGKSFNYVVITNEDYPRVFTAREKELQTIYDPEDLKYVFGPYTSGGSLNVALKIIRKIFPFRGKKDTSAKKSKNTRKSRLNEEIGLTPKFSLGVEKKEYKKTIGHIKLFFEGKKKVVIRELEKEMKELAESKKFEEAEIVKRKIFSLQHINDVALISSKESSSNIRIEGYDIAHISGSNMVGVMTVVEGGFPKPSDYRKFKIRSVEGSNDTGALKEVLERRLKHDEWTLPRLIVVDGGKAQINTANKVLKEFGYEILVVSVVKDERHKPKNILGDKPSIKKIIKENEREILLVNSEAHRFALSFHKQLRRKI